ncbi:MAG: Scr1 family TA system antitoxin-like transcriptional regulator [Mycobacteriales bacterium]
MTSETRPTAARRRLGAQLRQLREAAGLSGEQAAVVLNGSQAKISRLEGGVTQPGVSDVAALLELYGTDARDREELLELARTAVSRGRSWWRDYVDAFGVQVRQRAALESDASAILHCCPFVIPGVLQLPEYTRAVFERTGHGVSRDNIELAVSYQRARKEHVVANLSHYRVLTTPAALRWRPFDGFDLSAQLGSLAAEVSSGSCFELRVLTDYPMNGVLAPPDVSIITFDDTAVPAAGYLELPTGFHALETSTEIAYYSEVFTVLWGKALDNESSMAYLRSAVEYRASASG